LETHDFLLETNKLLSDRFEALAKKLEAQVVAHLASRGVNCDFCERYHESSACLPTNLVLSE